ncbi:YecA/YgfB family protein [Kushneria sp. Sum13]|uniref:YecA/YgfB family protein n=1 Tax=Kushneria sp. Sum13 TaxID=3459196 RepID=UPI0040465EBC
MNDITADTPQSVPLLEDERLDALFEFLDSERVNEEALDLFGAHGLLTALAISTVSHDRDERHALIFDTTPDFESDQQRQETLDALDALLVNAVEVFENGNLPDLPFDLEFEGSEEDNEEHPVRLWCAGFMEGVFLDEAAWFGTQEETAAELLLPFMTLSGLFDEEDPELAALGQQPAEATRLAGQLAELTLDLYLLQRAPVEKPAPAPSKGSKGAKGNSNSKGKSRGPGKRQ